jgi:hypothetical protein
MLEFERLAHGKPTRESNRQPRQTITGYLSDALPAAPRGEVEDAMHEDGSRQRRLKAGGKTKSGKKKLRNWEMAISAYEGVSRAEIGKAHGLTERQVSRIHRVKVAEAARISKEDVLILILGWHYNVSPGEMAAFGRKSIGRFPVANTVRKVLRGYESSSIGYLRRALAIELAKDLMEELEVDRNSPALIRTDAEKLVIRLVRDLRPPGSPRQSRAA